MPTFRFDASDLFRLTDRMKSFADELPAAVNRAVNRAGDQMVTAVRRELADETGLTQRDLAEDFSIERSTRATLEYALRIPSRTTFLGQYQPRQTRKGVSAWPWATRRIFPSTFLVHDEDVFRRQTKARYPLVPLFGPDPAKEAKRGSTSGVARATVNEVLPRRLSHEIGRLMQRKGAQSGGED